MHLRLICLEADRAGGGAGGAWIRSREPRGRRGPQDGLARPASVLSPPPAGAGPEAGGARTPARISGRGHVTDRQPQCHIVPGTKWVPRGHELTPPRPRNPLQTRAAGGAWSLLQQCQASLCSTQVSGFSARTRGPRPPPAWGEVFSGQEDCRSDGSHSRWSANEMLPFANLFPQ